MNPCTETSRPPLYTRKCANCRDMGYTLPPDFRGDRAEIPAGVLFHYGIPCACEAGKQFRHDQENWNRPIMPFKPPPRAKLSVMPKREPWPPPPWSDPPAPKAARPEISSRVTVEEIERLKQIQNANRKESAPQ